MAAERFAAPGVLAASRESGELRPQRSWHPPAKRLIVRFTRSTLLLIYG
jgi:hypothetical protein